MGAGFEQRAQVKGIDAQRTHMRQPLADLTQPIDRRGRKIIAGGRAAETERVNMIKDRIGCPGWFFKVHFMCSL